MMDPMATRSDTDVLGSAWPWSVVGRALLSVPPAPDSLAVATIARAPFAFANG